METSYIYGRADLDALLIARYYPERTGRESVVIRDWLRLHGTEYDRIAFSVRIGTGLDADPEHMDGIQRMTRYNSRMRIDVLAWRGEEPEIIEVKERVTAGVLGQLLGYRQLFIEENPGTITPRLTVIGRWGSDDVLKILTSHGITVYLYDPV